MSRIIIAGAGPVGTMLALYLAKRGLHATIIEKREDPLRRLQQGGRSINLALSVRGLHALKEMGIEKEFLLLAVPMRGRMVHGNGKQHYIPYSADIQHFIHSTARSELTKLLIEKARERPNIQIEFNLECLNVDLGENILEVRNTWTKERSFREFDVLFDAEGAGSAIRNSLLRIPYTNYTQIYLDYDYKEMHIPALRGSFQLEREAFHLWPRHDTLMIALPNPDGSFTCTLFLPHTGPKSFGSLVASSKISSFFEQEFPGVKKLIPDLLNQFLQRPVGHLATIKIFPWCYQDKVALIGDAAHGIVPFYGQGLNCGFEDCSFFNECMEKHGQDWMKVFTIYQNTRKKSADAIAELSLDNFLELREKSANPKFLLKKQLEIQLEALYPGSFLSPYSLVTFTRMPYEEALARGRRQDAILMEACLKVNAIDEINFSELFTRLQEG